MRMEKRETREDFPDNFYRETNPDARRDILLEALKIEDTPANRLRQRLLDLRYVKPARAKDGPWTDAYIKLWMSLKFAAQYAGSFFGGRGARRDVRRILEELEIARILEEGSEARELLYREFYHGACVYLGLCFRDRNYSSTLMGMVPMKEDSVQAKIARDIYESLYVGARFAQAEEELFLFRQAAKEAFEDRMPAQKEYLQELIDKG